MWDSTGGDLQPKQLLLPECPRNRSACSWRSSRRFRSPRDSPDCGRRCPGSRRRVSLGCRRTDVRARSCSGCRCCCSMKCSTRPCSRSCPRRCCCCWSAWWRMRSWHSPCCCSRCWRCCYCCCRSRRRFCCTLQTETHRRATAGTSWTGAGGGLCMGTCPVRGGSRGMRTRSGHGRPWPFPCCPPGAGGRRSRTVQSMSSWRLVEWSQSAVRSADNSQWDVFPESLLSF